MEWTLVYAFSKKLSTSEIQWKNFLKIFFKSVKYNKRFHKIKIYTDEHTLSYINHLDILIKVISFENYLFLDDIKIEVLGILEKNEVLIDPDIFLYKKLQLDNKFDLIVDRPVSINSYWYLDDIQSCKKYDFSKHLNFEVLDDITGNIGIMKFFNKELLNRYIDFYNKIKLTALNEKKLLPPFPTYSILLGEIGLKNVVDGYNYTMGFANKDIRNNYIHLAGENKSLNNLKPLDRSII